MGKEFWSNDYQDFHATGLTQNMTFDRLWASVGKLPFCNRRENAFNGCLSWPFCVLVVHSNKAVSVGSIHSHNGYVCDF